MKKASTTSIDSNKKVKIVNELDFLLSDLQLFYAKLSCFIENVSENEVHPYRQIYARMKDVGAEQIHKVLVRMIDLGGMPALNYNNELNNSKNKQKEISKEGAELAQLAVNYLDSLIKVEADIQIIATEEKDKVTASLMNSIIKEQERGATILLLILQKESKNNQSPYLARSLAVSC